MIPSTIFVNEREVGLSITYQLFKKFCILGSNTSLGAAISGIIFLNTKIASIFCLVCSTDPFLDINKFVINRGSVKYIK